MKRPTVAALLFLCCACSSVKKTPYAYNADPTTEISRLQLDMDKAVANQYDVLAPNEFDRAKRYFDSAKERRAENSLALWDDLGYARGWLNRAGEVYRARKPAAESTLRARQDALNAGARLSLRSSAELRALDESLRTNASSLGRNVKAQSQLDANYRGLEIIAVQEAQVGAARARIQEARDFGASRYAPRSLKEAESSLKEAQAAILRNPRDETAYMDEVDAANGAARRLVRINALARANARRSEESIAQEILIRDRELAAAKRQAAADTRALRATQRDLTALQTNVANQERLDQTLTEVRNKFSRDEANVYRDGDKLLIQLKKMEFKPGSSDLPGDSAPLLSKVKAVLRDVQAQDVVVQGHADSTGSPKTNKRVADARARTVADFLTDETKIPSVSAVGLSETRPIRSNKTAAGRATNRRVDLVITPTMAPAERQPTR